MIDPVVNHRSGIILIFLYLSINRCRSIGVFISLLVYLGLNLRALFINLQRLLLSLRDVVFNDSFAAKYDYHSCENQVKHSHENEG